MIRERINNIKRIIVNKLLKVGYLLLVLFCLLVLLLTLYSDGWSYMGDEEPMMVDDIYHRMTANGIISNNMKLNI